MDKKVHSTSLKLFFQYNEKWCRKPKTHLLESNGLSSRRIRGKNDREGGVVSCGLGEEQIVTMWALLDIRLAI
jgi:hypothetical protein